RIGEALIKAAILRGRKVDGRERAAAKRLDLRKRLALVGAVDKFPAGADPDRPGSCDRGQQGRRKAAVDRLIRLRASHPVRHEYQGHLGAPPPSSRGLNAYSCRKFLPIWALRVACRNREWNRAFRYESGVCLMCLSVAPPASAGRPDSLVF